MWHVASLWPWILQEGSKKQSGGACLQTPPDCVTLLCPNVAYFGASTISIWRPSMRG